MENEKVEGVHNGEDDEKMEKFFALIKSFQEARNRRKDELNALEENKKKKIRRVDEEQPSWVPSFKWEDFKEEIEFRKLPKMFPSPCNNKENKKQQEDDDGLDLNLTL